MNELALSTLIFKVYYKKKPTLDCSGLPQGRLRSNEAKSENHEKPVNKKTFSRNLAKKLHFYNKISSKNTKIRFLLSFFYKYYKIYKRSVIIKKAFTQINKKLYIKELIGEII